MVLHLPDEIIDPLNLSEVELRLELAVALYATHKLSFGKARQLAGLDWVRFRNSLAERGIPAHFDESDFVAELDSLAHLSSL